MKASRILLAAAKMVAKHNEKVNDKPYYTQEIYACNAIENVVNWHKSAKDMSYTQKVYLIKDTKAYFHLTKPRSDVSDAAAWFSQPQFVPRQNNEYRIIALLFAAQIAKSEGN